MERLLQAGGPLDLGLLDQTVNALNTTPDPAVRNEANAVLTALKESDNAWQHAGQILEASQNFATKFFALQILEHTIRYRWKALPAEQREGLRNYVVKKIIDVSSDEAMIANHNVRTFLSKLNLVLVQILKNEWPHNWPNFIPEIVNSSSNSEILCENNMRILRLLSEEVFDFSKEEMTSAKVLTLKTRLQAEFSQIFELCKLILSKSTRPSLVTVTLQTLIRFVAWIPLGYIFETELVDHLLNKFLLNTAFRNDTLACLTEIAFMEQPNYDPVFLKVFMGVMSLLDAQLPPETNIPPEFERAGENDQAFIRGLSLFFTTFFSKHLSLLELHQEHHARLTTAMYYLVSISLVDDDDIFKICLDFWNQFSRSLYNTMRQSGSQGQNPRLELYEPIMSRVRTVLISRMAKPEEVLIVEDDDGSIVRETTRDTDAIAQYNAMRDTLVFACHLNPEDCEDIMLAKLALLSNREMDGGDGDPEGFSWNNLNTLCWAIGSISGAMKVEDEKRFLVIVIKDLLGLVEKKRGKDNKAVVASNIMYVVGQYPRFLHAHWRFLRTVVKKLFEFMHELHPGVQDMACDTFLKISKSCSVQLVRVHPVPENPGPFLDELLETLQSTIGDLSPHQRLTFFEAVGYMVGEVEDEGYRNTQLERLMFACNTAWKQQMELGAQNQAGLCELSNLYTLAEIVRTNVRVCSAMGYSFRPQLQNIFLDLMHVYKFFGETILEQVREGGPAMIQHKFIKVMRVVRVETLKLLEVFVTSSANNEDVANNFCPVLITAVLADYERGDPVTRQPEVLQLFTAIVNKLRTDSNLAMDGKFVHQMLGPLFNPTLELITKDFVENPEHRVNFYKLLRALARYSFEQLFSVPPETQKSVVDSIVWAFKHPDRTISELGLSTLERVLQNVSTAPDSFAQPFYVKYYLSLVQDILYVLTDRLHKSSFAMHATILQMLFSAVAQGRVKEPLGPNGGDNRAFLLQNVSSTIVLAFPNVGTKVAEDFVSGMFDPQKDYSLFKSHVRDFLIKMREFSADEDNDQLFAKDREDEQRRLKQLSLQERAAIPGLLTKQEQEEMAEL